jgi:hypothetical protein
MPVRRGYNPNEFERRIAMTDDFLFLTTGKAAEYLSVFEG